MIRVLYITNESKNIYGSTYSLADMLVSLTKDVTPYIVFASKGKAYEYISSLGYECYIIPYKLNNESVKYKWLKFIPRNIYIYVYNRIAIFKISKLIKEKQISIIHSNSSVVTVGYCAAIHNGIKHIWHIREFQDLDFGIEPIGGWKRLKRMLKNSNASICITSAIAKHFGLSNNSNNYIINDAVRSINDVCCILPKDKYLLFCGSVTESKGAEKALNIFALFSKKHPDYNLLYIGKVAPEYKEYLRKIAIKYSVEEKIKFLGFQYNVRQYFEKATALLMCSKNEAQGRVTVEAMFFGCPIIGFKSGGTEEIIIDGMNGFLFRDEQEAVDKLESLVKDESLNAILISNGHKTAVNSFSIERYGEKIKLVYKSVLK